ncbi:MAG: CCA tRNA nucleotidyltransferase [Bacilli bacterium]|nr:CCA tRNA nucleotidyltransferase [Bacilli bacterium]MDD4053520.1 CCA tRNA nucleotidyltransferase [Bacilli bacterium]
MKEINVPNQVVKVLNTLENAGYEGYLVGGAIRDNYLNIKCDDYDIASSATVEEVYNLFANYKIIKTSLKHETVSLILDNLKIEITTYRDAEHTLTGDLFLRDFTIDSLAYSLKEGIIDYYNGVDDLNNKTIRINGDNNSRFIEDPVRILRAIRLSATLDFDIEPRTKNYILNDANLLKNVSVERIQYEFTKLLLSSNPSNYIREYFSALTVFMPELEPLKGFDQNNPHHIYDCLEHTLKVLDNVDVNIILRLSALFHDTGKPYSYTIDKNNIGHFYGHYKISAEITLKILRRLKYSNDIIDRVINLINFHDYPLSLTKKSVRKLLNRFGPKDINNLLALKKADTLGQSPDYWGRLKEIEEVGKIIDEIIGENDCFSLKDLKINGNDLMLLGITDGKTIGYILNQLLDLVIEEKLENNRELLLKMANTLNIKTKRKG